MFIWMMLVLKIPIGALFYIVWWSTRDGQPADEEPADNGRGNRPDPPPRPRRPRGPRRGPHAEPAPGAPSRVRARARTLSRSHD
jgi:hypothetical protein